MLRRLQCTAGLLVTSSRALVAAQEGALALHAGSSSGVNNALRAHHQHHQHHQQQWTGGSLHTQAQQGLAWHPHSDGRQRPGCAQTAPLSTAAASSSNAANGGGGSEPAAPQAQQPGGPVQPAGFTTLPPNATLTGYPQSSSAPRPPADAGEASGSAAASSSSASTSTTPSTSSSFSSRSSSPLRPRDAVPLPAEVLRVQLRQEVVTQEQAEQVDAYSLSRALMSEDLQSQQPGSTSTTAAAGGAPEAQAAAAAAQAGGLTASDRALLDKLVGIMTKDGKKSRARRILLDAMHIIKRELAKGPGQQQAQQGA